MFLSFFWISFNQRNINGDPEAAFGAEAVQRFFTRRVFNIVRITGLMIYALMFGVYIFLGANRIESELSRYIVLVIDIAVGLVVMSTMYGFYGFYTKGDL